MKNPFPKSVPLDAPVRSYGPRYRYRGKTVLPSGSPKAHTHGGHSVAFRGYVVNIDGKDKPVQMPPNTTRYSPPVRIQGT